MQRVYDVATSAGVYTETIGQQAVAEMSSAVFRASSDAL